ncbi:DUF6101 family protein [Ancylobacter lacus]|uniref:DUF6101 family protein n=1 Tax=Ancylobacter lacus TaxID=2579970 RepID=UPI001BCFFC0A|nr:DUF6101 family protein [Ancylobacter lacus]MBS7539654.1 hypothetical protein [Ancylobacter lacus]
MRQTETGGSHPARTTPHVRLRCPRGAQDWPLRFCAAEPAADDGLRHIAVARDAVSLTRRLGGAVERRRVPVAAYRGLAVVLLEPDGDGEGVALVLTHDDPTLDVVLHAAPDADDIVAEWRGWCAALGLPMLVPLAGGGYSPAAAMLGPLPVGTPAGRRGRRAALRHRRPSVFRRRSRGQPLAVRPRPGPRAAGEV